MRRYGPLRAAAVAVAEPPQPIQPTEASAPTLTVLPDPPAPDQNSKIENRKSGIKKLNLGGINKKKEEGKTTYPVLPDLEGKAAELAARIAERSDQFDALKSALETDKAELARIHVRPWYLTHFHRKTDVPSSVLVNWSRVENQNSKIENLTGAVRVTVKEQYYAFPTEEPFIPVLGNERVSKYFRQSFALKIDGDKLPSDKAGDLVEELQALFARHNCSEALESTECIVPVENFKALRFAELTVEESLALENLGDKGLTQCSVSTKNVRK